MHRVIVGLSEAVRWSLNPLAGKSVEDTAECYDFR